MSELDLRDLQNFSDTYIDACYAEINKTAPFQETQPVIVHYEDDFSEYAKGIVRHMVKRAWGWIAEVEVRNEKNELVLEQFDSILLTPYRSYGPIGVVS